jgi:CpeT protein
MKKTILFISLLVIAIGCKSSQSSGSDVTASKNVEDTPLKELVSIMQGNYSSEAHSKRDTTYYNISLKMIPIWKNKGNYLYVEQALVKKLDKPYRVRIYKLSQRNNEEFVSEIYTIKNEKKWIGKSNNPQAFNNLPESDLELKNGCEVILKRAGRNKFIGITGAKSCPSELRGASYATSKVNVYEDKIISWDQGFDKSGKQVWGATKSGYEFIKLK